MKQLKKLLSEKGIKPTYQRLKILEYMSKNMKNHPTVEIIHEELLKDIPTISLTTVYNTLNTFLEKGLVDGVTITGTETRYDLDPSSHHHFLCKNCGKIIDIEVQCAFAEGEKTVVRGNKIEEVHGYFKGICKECSDSLKSKIKKSNISRSKRGQSLIESQGKE
jgi:Fur family peroxide stress response transcriptional regulator